MKEVFEISQSPNNDGKNNCSQFPKPQESHLALQRIHRRVPQSNSLAPHPFISHRLNIPPIPSMHPIPKVPSKRTLQRTLPS